ncbi:MAG: DUF433 domain-containing protein [Lacipirellulaceae bacterium]
MQWQERITIDPDVLAGKPIIVGTRIGVVFLLELMAKGWTMKQLLDNYPQLQAADLQAVFAYSAARFNDDLIDLIEEQSPE